MFGPEHYNARASELEAAAKDVTSTRIKADYLELARRYRELANLSSLSGSLSAGEAIRLAMGKT
jgi:hypothetical protein